MTRTATRPRFLQCLQRNWPFWGGSRSSHGQKTRAWLSIPIGSMGREYLPTFTISTKWWGGNIYLHLPYQLNVGKYSSPMDPKRDWILVASLSGSHNVEVYEIIPIPVSSEIVCKNWCRHSPFRKTYLFFGQKFCKISRRSRYCWKRVSSPNKSPEQPVMYPNVVSYIP